MRISPRPRGITKLAILEIMIGLIALGMGLSILGDIYLGSRRLWFTVVTTLSEAGLLGFLIYRIQYVLVALGLLYLTVGYGLWRGVKWVYYLSILSYSLNLVLGALLLPWGIVLILFSVSILYYHTRPHVRKFFK